MSGFVDINGKLSREEEALISFFDRGFLLGDACFEVLKVEEKKFLFLEDHLERLFKSLAFLGIFISRESLVERMKALLFFSSYSLAYFRITITRGNGSGFSGFEKFKPNVYLYIKEIKKESPREVRLKIVRDSSLDRSFRIKTNAYQKTFSALSRAESEGYDDILWLNSEGEVTEASSSNIFFLKEREGVKKVVTPSLSAGFLAGVTRKNLIKFLKEKGINIEENVIKEEDLLSYDSCFLTSSIKGFSLVKSLNKRLYNTKEASVFIRELVFF